MAQRKYTRFACNECHQRAEQLVSADELVVKFRCNSCLKQWKFHVDERGFLLHAVVTNKDGEVSSH